MATTKKNKNRNYKIHKSKKYYDRKKKERENV